MSANVNNQYDFFKKVNLDANGNIGVVMQQPFAFTADNYTALLALTGMVDGDLAYIVSAQGTQWLPGTIGGDYYPSGIYVYASGVWTSDRNAISYQLHLDDERLDSLELNDLQNRILVTQSNYTTTIGGVIDSTKEYFLDGIIDVGTTQITVPTTGISIKGYTFDLSGLTSSEDNYTMFISESPVIGSGNMLGSDYLITTSGTNSKVYEIYDATGFNAFEFQRVNYIDCSSLGDIHNYRQGLESGTGRFGGSPSLTLHGTWVGGFRVTTSIVRSMSDTTTEPLFKAGTAFVMNSRFLTDINVDLGTLQPLLDFSPANFTNPSTLQLKGCIVSRDGVIDSTDSNITPNISNTDIASDWDNNQGLRNTFVGGKTQVTTQAETVISSVSTFYDINGIFTANNLQHFDSPSQGQLRHLGKDPIEFNVLADFNIESAANNVIAIRITKYDASTASFLDFLPQLRQVNSFVGGRDVAFFTISGSITLEQNDYIKFQVANETGTANATLEDNSFYTVQER